MTEKRFEYIKTKYRQYIQDIEKDGEWKKGYRGTYGDFELDKITDLLNQLNDENEQLKESNERFSKTVAEQIIIIKEYREENEQLRQVMGFLENDNANDILEVLNSREGIFEQLRNENEQLKKELERCKDWINSDKNDYELTLSFIKNKGYSLKDVLEYEKELKK